MMYLPDSRFITGLLTLLTATVAGSTHAGTMLADNFSTSTLNSGSPAAPTASSAAYHLFSSKGWSPAPTIGANDLKFGITPTSAGHIEMHALFSAPPIALTTIGDYVELTITFVNTSGLLTQSGQMGFGLYNSGGVPPIAGGLNATAVSSTLGVTGGAQGWQGYVSRLAYSGGSHRLAVRPAQAITTGNNQDLITEGSGSQSYLGNVNLASTASTLTQPAGSQLTKTLRLTLGPANTLQIESRLYSGVGTNGALLHSQNASASGANFLTSSFDALALGWRDTGNSSPTLIDIQSLTVTTSLPIGGPSDTVAGIYFQQQPPDARVGVALSPAVTLVATNASGIPVTNAPITLSLASGSGPLNGTLSKLTDASGAAIFDDLSFNSSGAKQLRATSGLSSAVSDPFNITNRSVAFPGAEGAGASATGGRGGDVYYVTTLANTGTGSLRNGISGAPAGGRTILFKVSGNIVLTSTLTVNKPNITIAGQTAPGDGICIQNYSFNIAANNVIVRHLRTRLGTNALQEADAMWINSGTNIIVDHVSASWSVDEVLSASTDVANLTVQNCFITEALNNSIHIKGAHGYGGIISASANTTYSYLRNLYAHNQSRNPRIGSDAQAGTLRLDFRNNVIYNYGGRAGYTGGTDESTEINYVNNYCVKGPSSTYNYILQGGGSTTHVYQNGNFIDLNRNGLVDGADTGWGMFSQSYTPFATPFAVPDATTEPAPVAYQRVVALSGAMPWRRDSSDQRIASTVRQQNGSIIDAVAQVGGWPTLQAEPAPADTDNDGMPDFWELANGSNPNLASDRNITNPLTGYTKLEEYLNWRADAHALCDKNGSVDVNLRTATGGATNLTYAVANDLNGTVTQLGDSYTARFTAAANTNGVANFTFTATGNGTTFGPMNYGILITTTNAPVFNTAPSLAPITNHTFIAGTTINFTNAASDPDVPAQTLTFSLLNSPSGASVNSSNGIFNWRPIIAQSPTTNSMSVIVTDNGMPNLSATQRLTITVLLPVSPTIQPASFGSGTFQFQVSGDAGPDYTILASTNLLNWSPFFTTNPAALPFHWTDPNAASFNQRYFRILLGP